MRIQCLKNDVDETSGNSVSRFAELQSETFTRFANEVTGSHLVGSLIKILEDIHSSENFRVLKQRHTCELYEESNRIFSIRISGKPRLILSLEIANQQAVIFILDIIEEHEYRKSIVEKKNPRLVLLEKVNQRIAEIAKEAEAEEPSKTNQYYYKKQEFTLKPQQQAIADHPGPKVLIAPSGTGKTVLAVEGIVSHLQHEAAVLCLSPTQELNAVTQEAVQVNCARRKITKKALFFTPKQLVAKLEALLDIAPPSEVADYTYFQAWFAKKQEEVRASGVTPKKLFSDRMNLLAIEPFTLYMEFTQVIIQPGIDVKRPYLTLEEYQKLAPHESHLKLHLPFLYDLFRSYIAEIPSNLHEPHMRIAALYHQIHTILEDKDRQECLPNFTYVVVDEFPKIHLWMVYLVFAMLAQPSQNHWLVAGDAHQCTDTLRKQLKTPLERMLKHYKIPVDKIHFQLDTVYRSSQKVTSLGNLFLAIKQAIWGSTEQATTYGLDVSEDAPLGKIALLNLESKVPQANGSEIPFAQQVRNDPNTAVIIPSSQDRAAVREIFGSNVFYASGCEGLEWSSVILYGFSSLEKNLQEMQQFLKGNLPEINTPIVYGRKKDEQTPSAETLNVLSALYTAEMRAKHTVVFCDAVPSPFLNKLVNHVDRYYEKAQENSAVSVQENANNTAGFASWFDVVSYYCDKATVDSLNAAEALLLGDQLWANQEERARINACYSQLIGAGHTKQNAISEITHKVHRLIALPDRAKWLNLLLECLERNWESEPIEEALKSQVPFEQFINTYIPVDSSSLKIALEKIVIDVPKIDLSHFTLNIEQFGIRQQACQNLRSIKDAAPEIQSITQQIKMQGGRPRDKTKAKSALLNVWKKAELLLTPAYEPEVREEVYTIIIPFTLSIENPAWLLTKLEQLIVTLPECPWTNQWRSDCKLELMESTDLVEFDHLMDLLRKAEFSGSEICKHIVRIFQHLEELDTCLEALNAAIKYKHPYFNLMHIKSLLLSGRSEIFIKQKNYKEARKDILNSLKIHFAPQLFAKYQMLAGKATAQQTINECKELLTSHPTTASIYGFIASILMHTKEFTLLLTNYDKALCYEEDAEKISELYAQRGEVYLKMGRLEHALADFLNEKTNQNTYLSLQIAHIYRLLLQHDKAIEYFVKIYQENPLEHEVLLDLTFEYVLAGNNAEALRTFTELSTRVCFCANDTKFPILSALSKKEYAKALQHCVEICQLEGLDIRDKVNIMLLKSLIFHCLSETAPVSINNEERSQAINRLQEESRVARNKALDYRRSMCSKSQLQRYSFFARSTAMIPSSLENRLNLPALPLSDRPRIT